MQQTTCSQAVRTGVQTNPPWPKDEFLAIVGHELRTPTTAILGWIEVLRQNTLDDKTFSHAIDTIRRNAQLQSQLIEHLLDFSQLNRDDFKLEIQTIAILPTVKAAIETMTPLAVKKDIQIDFEPDFDSPWIIGDTFRLQQVFTNLLSNAIKVTPSSGRIRITVAGDLTTVEVKVSDNGSGISAESLPGIFNGHPKVTNHDLTAGGLGLGLEISRRLIERHGGQIDAFSDGEGRGATFVVYLPRA